MTLRSVAAGLLLGASLLAAPALAQPAPAAASPPTTGAVNRAAAVDLEPLRTELRASRKGTVEGYLKLTADEAARFWPLYDRYAADLTEIKDTQYELIIEYVNTYGRYDDKSATDFITRWVDLDVRSAALRARYVPLVGQVLPGLKTATFFQIDRRISLQIDMRVVSELSVLQAQDGN